MSEPQESALAGRRIDATTRLGIATAATAYVIWGLVPVFFKQLAGVPAAEIIAHRILWSLLFMVAVLGFGRGFGRGFSAALALARQPTQLLRVAIASALVMINWLTFVYGVNAGRILETSLGYFMLPLFNVALGVVILKERLRSAQWLAVVFAAAGVGLETWRIGGLPWISLVLAGSFGIYGLLRKQLPLDAASGLFLETACMTPLAVCYLLYLFWFGEAGAFHFGLSLSRDLLLIASGVVTAVPLLLFAIGARRLPMNVMGFLQYLAPTLTFLLAVFVYGEAMNPARLISFALIWTGLAVFTTDLVRNRGQ
jgi:chloramphenicol-sensitive protein RarD